MAESYNSTTTMTRDNLRAGTFPATTKAITLLSGQNCVAGTLLGKIKKVCPTSGTAKVGNTGNGTCTSVTAGNKAQLGTYTLRATAATVFSVFAPDGTRLFDAATGTAYTTEQINFSLAAGGTAFVAGDEFTIAITAGSEKYKKALLAAVDGSQDMDTAVILARDTDATSADVETDAYETGEFNQNEITFGTGLTIANTKESLAKRCLFLRDSQQR